MKTLQELLLSLRAHRVPHCLRTRGRHALPVDSFKPEEKLYRAYRHIDLNDDGSFDLDRLRFPDMSCNWSRFSKPVHVRWRYNGNATDGCYSFTVEASRYKSMATPVHYPETLPLENYSHVEVRWVGPGEEFPSEPPRKRKKPGWTGAQRQEYRHNILSRLYFELDAIPD